MKVMDPEKDKKSKFVDCAFKNLSQAASSINLMKQAKVKGSSALAGGEAQKAIDGRDATAWKPDGASDQWLQVVFPAPRTINEFKLKEDPSSSITRYEIQYWDAARKAWAGCFNGRGIGPDFVAPIVARTTSAVRLKFMQTAGGNPAITEFGAYNDPVGTPFNDATGAAAVGVIGK